MREFTLTVKRYDIKKLAYIREARESPFLSFLHSNMYTYIHTHTSRTRSYTLSIHEQDVRVYKYSLRIHVYDIYMDVHTIHLEVYVWNMYVYIYEDTRIGHVITRVRNVTLHDRGCSMYT